jgi:hypothetical protein
MSQNHIASIVVQMKTLAEKWIYRIANMTADINLQYQVSLFGAETEGTTGCMADRAHITDCQNRELYEIASNKKKWFKKVLSIHLIQFEV